MIQWHQSNLNKRLVIFAYTMIFTLDWSNIMMRVVQVVTLCVIVVRSIRRWWLKLRANIIVIVHCCYGGYNNITPSSGPYYQNTYIGPSLLSNNMTHFFFVIGLSYFYVVNIVRVHEVIIIVIFLCKTILYIKLLYVIEKIFE
jgi:hypothetical protein